MKYYYKIIELLRCIDIEKLPWVYGFLKEYFFGENGVQRGCEDE